MKKLRKFLCGIVLVVSQRLWAAPQTYTFEPSIGKNEVRFYSKATVEDFEGTAEQLNGSVTIDFGKPELNLSARFSVVVASMKTGLALRDKHMLSKDWLNAEKHPIIRFDVSSTDPKNVRKTGDNQWFVKATGTWTIKGNSKSVEVPVTLTRMRGSADRIHLKSRFPLHLSDYGIRGPMGMNIIGVKVSPNVTVDLNLEGEVQQGWAAPAKKKQLQSK